MYAVVGHSAERHLCYLQIERAKELQVLLGYDNHDVQPVLARLCVLCMCARTKTDKRSRAACVRSDVCTSCARTLRN